MVKRVVSGAVIRARQWGHRDVPEEAVCVWCEIKYEPKRQWQRYCSQAHRVAASRARKGV